MEQNLPLVGSPAPDFLLPNDQGTQTSLGQLKGSWAVLYFYPKDNTSGCTIEALEFSALIQQFAALNARVFGVSPDSIQSHCRFRDAKSLTVTLLSDPEAKVLEAYGAWKMKSMYGRQYLGVERSTVLISPEGLVAHHWTKVKAAGHADEVLQRIRELGQAAKS